jgi:cell division protein FtsA
VVLTGGSCLLPGIRQVAADVMRMPVRIAHPEKLTGMADTLRSPSFSTSVGLLRLGLLMDMEDRDRGGAKSRSGGGEGFRFGKALSRHVRRFQPEEEKS